MPNLIDIQHDLQETIATLAQLESATARDGMSPALLTSAQSLRKRQQVLEAQFQEAADQIGIDICSYRMLTDGVKPSISHLASGLSRFQNLFSLVYDSVKNGRPKERLRVSGAIEQESSFEFAYTYPGSVGFALTLKNERYLGLDSSLDQAFAITFQLMQAEEVSDIRDFADQLGRATIKAAHDWAYEHYLAGFGVDIQWRRNTEIRSSLSLQKPRLERLYQTIDFTSDQTEEILHVEGQLLGADVTGKSFHMLLDSGEHIRGSSGDSINEQHTVQLPNRYVAVIVKSTMTQYSTDTEKASFRLSSLTPIEPPN